DATVISRILGILSFKGKWISREDEFFDDPAVDQMFLDDPLQNFGRARVIPDPFRINDRDRAMHADAKTIRFCAKYHRSIALPHPELLEPVFKVFPRFDALFLRATFGLGLISAEKDVPMEFPDPQRLNFPLQFFLLITHGVFRKQRSFFPACDQYYCVCLQVTILGPGILQFTSNISNPPDSV